MRRTIIAVTVVLTVVVAAAAAEAGSTKRYRREVQASYIAGPLSPNVAIVDGNTCLPGGVGCVFFQPTGREAYIKVTLTDDHGGVVAGSVFQEGTRGPVAQICGSTNGFVAINPGNELHVSVQQGECNGEPAIATSGTVTATFTSRP